MTTTAELVKFLRGESCGMTWFGVIADRLESQTQQLEHETRLLNRQMDINDEINVKHKEQLEKVKAATEGCEQSNCPCCTKIDAILKDKS